MTIPSLVKSLSACPQIDISLPLRATPRSGRVTCLGLPHAALDGRLSIACKAGGDKGEDGGFGCDVLTDVCFHTQCTHVESMAHLGGHEPTLQVLGRLSPLMVARVVSVSPRGGQATASGAYEIEPGNLEECAEDASVSAVILKTGWLDGNLRSAASCESDLDLGALDHPYLSCSAIDWICQKFSGASVILVDLPSIDPRVSGGVLRAHRHWFSTGKDRLVVELCRIRPEMASSRSYILSLNAASVDSDAIPCRPVLILW